MPNKTLYIKASDVAMWKRASELSGGYLSPVIVNFLRQFVAERESMRCSHGTPVSKRCLECAADARLRGSL